MKSQVLLWYYDLCDCLWRLSDSLLLADAKSVLLSTRRLRNSKKNGLVLFRTGQYHCGMRCLYRVSIQGGYLWHHLSFLSSLPCCRCEHVLQYVTNHN